MNDQANSVLEAIRTQIKTPSPTLANIVTRYAYFDPVDHIDTTLTELKFKARMVSRAAWLIDMQIINSAIGLYFQIKKENPLKKELGEYIDAFKGSYSNEGYWGTGHARTLAMLVAIQDTWHALAYKLNRANGYDSFQVKSIDEMILTAQPRELTIDGRMNLMTLAELSALTLEEAGATPAEQERAKKEAYERMCEQQRVKALKNVDDRKMLLPAIKVFVDAARGVFDASKERMEKGVLFSDMPARTRLGLVRGMHSGIGKVLDDLAPYTDSNTFGMITAEAFVTRRIMGKVVELLGEEVAQESHD